MVCREEEMAGWSVKFCFPDTEEDNVKLEIGKVVTHVHIDSGKTSTLNLSQRSNSG